MYRFLLRPRWLALHCGVLAAIVVMTSLGFWQIRRLDERREFNTTVESRVQSPPVDLTAELAASVEYDPDANQWRPVRVLGTYLADETVVVVNRSIGGTAGLNVVVPLRAPDGTVILVNRGFVPLSVDPDAVPEGTVTVTGYLRRSETRRIGGAVDATGPEVTEFQRFDIDAISTSLSADAVGQGNLVAMYLQAANEDPPADGQWPAEVPLPILDEGPHLSYAVQWFFFSAFVVAGWVVVVRRGLTDRRRATGAPASESA